MSEKYPRTPHLPWSHGRTDDDKTLDSAEHLVGVELVITEKVDGSNLCLTTDAIFARSHRATPTHKSFDLAKSIYGEVKHLITPGISVFGEYCHAVHSIEYSALPGFFLIFGVREDSTGQWRAWDEVRREAQRLNLPTVGELWRGRVKTEQQLQELSLTLAEQPSLFGGKREGLVVRLAERFSDFSQSTAKWVREDHVQVGAEHWMNRVIRHNGLRHTAADEK